MADASAAMPQRVMASDTQAQQQASMREKMPANWRSIL